MPASSYTSEEASERTQTLALEGMSGKKVCFEVFKKMGNENASLKAQLAGEDAETLLLKEDLRATKATVSSLTMENSGLICGINQLEAEKHDLDLENIQLKVENAQLKKQCEGNAKKAAEDNLTITSLLDEIQTKTKSIAEQAGKIVILEEREKQVTWDARTRELRHAQTIKQQTTVIQALEMTIDNMSLQQLEADEEGCDSMSTVVALEDSDELERDISEPGEMGDDDNLVATTDASEDEEDDNNNIATSDEMESLTRQRDLGKEETLAARLTLAEKEELIERQVMHLRVVTSQAVRLKRERERLPRCRAESKVIAMQSTMYSNRLECRH